MSKVERGVVKGPNQTQPGNRVDSCGPMGKQKSSVNGPNQTRPGDHAASGFNSMSRHGNSMPNPNADQKFSVENARLGQQDPVVAPGRPAIPVNPFTGTNTPLTSVAAMRDTAKRPK